MHYLSVRGSFQIFVKKEMASLLSVVKILRTILDLQSQNPVKAKHYLTKLALSLAIVLVRVPVFVFVVILWK